VSGSRPIAGADGEVRAIRLGQVATFESGGGFVRKPAPADGILFDLRETTVFVKASDVRAALRGTSFRDEKLELRLAKRGEGVARPVSGGGFVRRPLEFDALVVGTRSTNLLLPVAAAKNLLAELRQEVSASKLAAAARPRGSDRSVGR
jgi:hypothetical protein